MKRILFTCMLILVISNVFSQSKYNRWSIEASIGPNKPMGPLTPGFLSPTLNLGHADLGLRYMINDYFGFKGDLGVGSFSEAAGVSPVFTTNYFRMNIQAVGNIGKMIDLPSLSRKLGMLAHFGTGFGRMSFENTRLDTQPDYHYNFIGGVTTLYKLGKRAALTGDISIIYNGRQTYTFDGNAYNAPFQPIIPKQNPLVHAPGTWWTGTIGVAFYLGKNETHADWYVREAEYATKEELASQINGLKDMLNDADGDGIPDYLDKEPNTPVGARVNSMGMTLDSDGDGTSDHMDQCPFLPGPSSTSGCPVEEINDQLDYFRKALNDGYVNVYYAFDSDKPLVFSISAVAYVANFLKKNPGVSVEVKGYADELGTEDYNMKLSERRAKAVYDLLTATGIDESRISFKGNGEDTRVDKTSVEARQMARRASFEIK